MWRLTSVPDQNAAVVRRACKYVVIDGVDGQAVHGVYMQEHVQSFSSAGESDQQCEASAVLFITTECASGTKLCQFLVSPTSPHHEGSPVRHFLWGKVESTSNLGGVTAHQNHGLVGFQNTLIKTKKLQICI